MESFRINQSLIYVAVAALLGAIGLDWWVRYAKGEIDKKEFEEKRKDFEG